VPAVSVDEALELFLALTFPNGLPEGIDREGLVEQMRARIAGDRPQWAAAGQDAAPPAAADPAASYSEVKAAAARKALEPDLPSDPQERYLEERRREAEEHRVQRQEEARADKARAELLHRLLAGKREADSPVQAPAILPEPRWTVDASLRERAPQSVQAPGIGLGPALQLETPVPGAPARPDVGSRPAVASLELSGPELATMLRELTPDEQLAVLRGFGASRRALLKRREDVLAHRQDLLADRRPARKADRGEPLAFSPPPKADDERLSVEAPASRRVHETDRRPAVRRERLRVEP